jgi:transcriptional regulator with XRE-family HTH domain
MNDFRVTAKQTNEIIAVYFNRFRKEQRLTLSALARKVGSSSPFISKCENDGRRIDVGEFLRICNGLSINPVEFIKKIKTKNITLHSIDISAIDTKNRLNDTFQLKDLKATIKIVSQAVAVSLKAIRAEQKLSMRIAAQKIGVKHSFIGKIECCDRRLDIGEFIHYYEAMDNTPSDALLEIINVVNKQ